MYPELRVVIIISFFTYICIDGCHVSPCLAVVVLAGVGHDSVEHRSLLLHRLLPVVGVGRRPQQVLVFTLQ